MSLPPESDDATPPVSPYAAASATPTGNLHAAPPVPPRPLDKPTSGTTPPLDTGYAPASTVPGPGAEVLGTEVLATEAPTGPIPASVGRRSGAFILDLFLTFTVVLVATIFTFSFGFNNAYLDSGLVGVLGIPAIAIVANTVMVWLFGCTLGQRMTGLRVVDAATGRLIGPGRTLARLAIIISPILLLVLLDLIGSPVYGLWGAGFGLSWVVWVVWFAMLLFAALSGRGSVHDIATKTTVVRGSVAS